MVVIITQQAINVNHYYANSFNTVIIILPYLVKNPSSSYKANSGTSNLALSVSSSAPTTIANPIVLNNIIDLSCAIMLYTINSTIPVKHNPKLAITISSLAPVDNCILNPNASRIVANHLTDEAHPSNSCCLCFLLITQL